MPSNKERAQKALEEISTEEAEKYLKELRESWEEVTKSLNRSTIAYCLIVALFELLIGSKQELRFTVAGFQFANSATLQKALPALAGYFYCSSMTYACKWLACEEVFDAFYKKLRPQLYGQDLEVELKPSAGPWNIGLHFPGDSGAQRFGFAIQLALGSMFLFIIPLAFAAHSAFLLIDKFGGGDVFTIFTISLSGALVIAGMAYGLWDRETRG
ncbi:hypothetical protein [Streptomyces griseorubiginosus]|uniref:Uncharacterized protein n=1 Tax=Streptomyces griseorubiginosus TaxID=67304 RepID=A0A101RU38_9ACTN|nr:hypothetical protein [Streptomyces griseorubiginosus]KUN61760.1 hypothetical protein AQJ54_31945 [Streptomyces griseorubiginosus]